MMLPLDHPAKELHPETGTLKQVPCSHEATIQSHWGPSVNWLHGNNSSQRGHSCDPHSSAASRIFTILQQLLVSPTWTVLSCQSRLGLQGYSRSNCIFQSFWDFIFIPSDAEYEGECKQSQISTYPGMFPPGPMEVLNIRLKETGGDRSLPVMGDFTL